MVSNGDTTVNKGGRPVVINEERITIAEQLLTTPAITVVWTDNDIVEEVNYRLMVAGKGKYSISPRSYQRYKAKMLANSLEELGEIATGDMIVIERFWRLIKAKLRFEKLNILGHMITDPKRQRRAWLFERKFNSEFGLPAQQIQGKAMDGTTNTEDTEVTEIEVTILTPDTVAT